jgi:hypothetical protein
MTGLNSQKLQGPCKYYACEFATTAIRWKLSRNPHRAWISMWLRSRNMRLAWNLQQ